MRYHEIIGEDARTMTLYSYWDLVRYYGVEREAQAYHDKIIPWVNRNNRESIDRLIANPKYRLVSQLQFFVRILKKHQNFGDKWTTPQEFEAAANDPITLWRGGGKIYDPKLDAGEGWRSFTASRRRATAFSVYDGTHATRAFVLPKRDQYWVMELTVPLKDILLYIDGGGDEECIVSKEDARRGEIIQQSEPGQRMIGEDQETESTITLWHGGRDLESGYHEVRSHGKGRWEHGPGLYLTTSYMTAAKYAKGGGKLYKVTVRKGTDISDVFITYDQAMEFVNKAVVGRKRKEMAEDLKTNMLRRKADRINAEVLVNLCLNTGAIPNSKTNLLRQFLIDHGVDYIWVKHYGGSDETVVVVVNPKVIAKVEAIPAKDVKDNFKLSAEFS